MQVQKLWAKPELTVYGSVENITEQIIAGKTSGSGDSIQVTVEGVVTNNWYPWRTSD